MPRGKPPLGKPTAKRQKTQSPHLIWAGHATGLYLRTAPPQAQPNFGVLVFGGRFTDPGNETPYIVSDHPAINTTPAGTCHRRHMPPSQVTPGTGHRRHRPPRQFTLYSRNYLRQNARGKDKDPLAFAFVLPPQIMFELGVGKRTPSLRSHLLRRRPCPLPSLPPEPPLPTPAPPIMYSNSGGRVRGSMGLRFRCASLRYAPFACIC